MSEISDAVKAISLVADAREATLENEIKNLQQHLSLKDREIMRLREAFEEIVKKENTEENEWDAVEVVIPAMCAIAKQALSTPTTYEDLMAWHEAQLGECKKDAERYEWILDNCYQIGDGKGIEISFFVPFDHEDLSCAISQTLYAKKG